MKKNVAIATGIGIAIIIGVIIFQVEQTLWQQVSVDEYYEKSGKVAHVVYPDNPQILGPLQINKDKYLIGENVYVVVTDIPKNLKTQLLFYTPSGKQFYEIPIDGEKVSGFKQYFKPQLLKNRNLCDVNELVGQWTMLFENNPSEDVIKEVGGEVTHCMNNQAAVF